MNDIKKVENFFDSYSEAFDAIYDNNSSNFFNKIINNLFRKAMRKRFELTLNYSEMLGSSVQTVLDIGCGPGRYCEIFSKLNKDVTGIDIASQMIQFADNRSKQKNLKIKYLVGDYANYEFNNKFDLAILMGFFDYIKDANLIISKLKKDCNFFCASFPKAKHWLTIQRKIRYAMRNCPLFFYEDSQIREILKKNDINNFEIVEHDREYFVSASLS